MKKFLLFIVLATLCLFFRAEAQKSFTIKGRVTDSSDNKPIQGATIKIILSKVTTSTNEKGEFSINSTVNTGRLLISYIGYKTIQVSFDAAPKTDLNISLAEEKNALNEVSVVSTGYQTLPKERATGSFVLVDSALLNRSIGTNILDRLNGVTSGLLFNPNIVGGPNQSTISIRGTSTILASEQPLIVLDNFPYEGDPGKF